MERRSSPRRPIHLRATLNLGDFKPQSCVISDYCPGGLFLQYGASLTQSLARQQGTLAGRDGTVSFQDPTDKQEYQLAIKVARLLDGAMGVMLTAPQGAALAAMERIARVEESRQAALVLSNSTTVILRQCTGAIQTFLKPLFEQFLQELGPSLVQAADQASNDAQRTEYFDAEAIFRTQPGRITAQFFQEMNAPLSTGERPSGATAPSAAELSLIEKTEFEHWLTLKVMVTKAETEYRGSLLQLKLRLDKIGYVSALGYQNPLGPPLIGYAFRDTLVALKLSPSAEKVCYRLFERTVMKQLDPLYQELNQLMIRAGVLPNLDLSKYLSPKVRATEAPVEPATVPLDKKAPSSTPATSEQVRDQLAHAQSAFTTLNSLFGQLDRIKRKGSTSQVPVWRPDELQRIVAELQAQRLQHPVVDPNVSLRKQLESQLRRATDSHKELPAEQRESVDVVDQFFGTLVRNARLSDVAKVQVKRLELPVLKMLMQDRQLFEKRDTAILAVINRIAELGASGARPSPIHNERVTKLINRICEQIDEDTAVLDEAMAELNDMLERQNLLFRRNVERVAAAAEGAQKVAESKRVVADEINRRVQGQPIPRAIAGLINGGWRDLLSLTYIRQGPDSPAWRNYLGVLDILLAVREDPDHRFNLADLLQLIQEGLASISSNHMPSGNIRDDLKKFLTRPEDAVETVELRVSAEQDALDDARALSEVRRRGLQRWLVRAQKFRVGDWVRFARDEDDVQYVRLVWIGKGCSRYVFVNHQGMKVVDLDQYKLATYLQRGIMVLDPGHETSVVDQSLDAMVKEVYDQLSHAASHDEVTKLINRKEFERGLEATLTGAEPGQRFSVIHLDLRQFKMLNDTAGADAGDQILAEIAGLLRTLAPEPSLVARLGGNEFAALIEQGQAEALAQRYLKAVQDYRLQWQNRSYGLAVSVGVADLAQDFTDAAQALKVAEQACRRSKAEGVNRLFHLAVGAQPAADQQDRIVAKIAGLRDDLKGERILLRCQKVIPLHAKARIGSQYQIMFTIYDDQGQLIPAYDFVRLAERHNRMAVVDRWVVGHMLDWMAQNRAKLETLSGFSVSLSGQSLDDEKLQEFIFERATQTGAPLDKLCFEISEAAAVANIQDVTDFMHEMREYGCRFCLTNFGSGLSSYKFLKMLPVDLIRIDGSFVKNLAHDMGDQMMIRSMTEMVHFLGKELVATQVEDKAALELLRSLSVDYAQGYCIEKPSLLSRL